MDENEQEISKRQRNELRRRRARNKGLAVGIGIFGLIFLLPILPYIGGVVGFHFEVSEGDRIGQIVKLSHKGIVWKTWEGTLAVTQSGAYVEAWNFSIDPKNSKWDDLVSKIRQAYTTGALVRIHYTQRLLPLYWRGKTSYFADEIELARSK